MLKNLEINLENVETLDRDRELYLDCKARVSLNQNSRFSICMSVRRANELLMAADDVVKGRGDLVKCRIRKGDDVSRLGYLLQEAIMTIFEANGSKNYAPLGMMANDIFDQINNVFAVLSQDSEE